jgi:acyl-CoA dehydrogenase
MDFDFDSSMKEVMAKHSSAFSSSYWREVCLEKRFPTEYWNAIAASGLFGILVEKKYGGMAKGILDLALAVEETAERFAGLASYLYLSECLTAEIFTRLGTESQKREFLPKLASGNVKMSIALSEENSGLDASAIKSTATKSSVDSYLLSGKKAFVNNVDQADYLIFFARTKSIEEAGKKMSGMTMFLVPVQDNKNIRARKLEKIGFDFVNNFSIEVEDLKVDQDQILGRPDLAWYDMINVFNLDRIMTSASLVGTARLALTQASEWAKNRIVFGRPIGSNQGIQFPLADSIAQVEAARAMLLKAASLADQGKNFVNEPNYSLISSSNAALTATDRALQSFGGHGYYKEYDVERYWRDVRLHKFHPVSEELLLASIAERSLGLPKSY